MYEKTHTHPTPSKVKDIIISAFRKQSICVRK